MDVIIVRAWMLGPKGCIGRPPAPIAVDETQSPKP